MDRDVLRMLTQNEGLSAGEAIRFLRNISLGYPCTQIHGKS